MSTLLLFAAGGALLIAGAELLVRGASRLARNAGVSPLVIGLTVVAFGTSSPELAVTVGAATGGNADVALGNVVGSNIMNILLILGVSAIITPLVVAQQLVRLDVPLLVGISLAAWVLALDGSLGRLEGVLLVAGGAAYTAFLIRASRRETVAVRAEYEEAFGGPPERSGRVLADVVLVIVGLAMLAVGARLLVDAAVTTARVLGVSELVIGLTVVAAGTSLPEVAASVLAALRGERDIAVGNVVGSNIFNLLFVAGLGAIAAPRGLEVAPAALTFDLPVMVAVAAAALPVLFTGHLIARWEGVLFVAYYVAYVTYVVMDANGHDALPRFGAAMKYFVLPLTAVTLAVMAARALRRNGRSG